MSDQPRAVQPPPTAALSEWSRAGWSLKSSPCQDPHGLPILSLSFSRPSLHAPDPPGSIASHSGWLPGLEPSMNA